MSEWPFCACGSRDEWRMVEADGFPNPVPGCIYDGARLDGGVPLGGLGTGYFTLEGTGKIGFCSIYNDIVPPRSDFAEWLTVRVGETQMPLSTATIAYWGHFPVADLVARFAEEPLTVGIRAFSPFIAGDAGDSNIPAVLFEIEVRNRGDVPKDITLSVLPPAPTADKKGTVALLGNGLATDSGSGRLRGTIQATVPAQGSWRVRFVFAWHFPYWRDSGSEAHVNRYAGRYENAEAVAQDALKRFDTLLGRVLAWQQVIYESDLPEWLRDALVQGLYSLAKNTVWIARTRKDEWWGADGWFTHSESHTGCPITETMVCRMHGHFPALFFFPQLERSTLDAFKHFQISDGEVPFAYGMKTSMRDPRYHCQHPLNSGQYAQMIYRLFQRTGDREQLAYFYESAKRAIRYQYTLDDDEDGLVNDQAHVQPGEFWPANQFYDCWPWWGTSAYVAGTWLGTLACGKALAEAMGDAEFAAECSEWLAKGQAAYDAKLWTGEYYRLWTDPENDRVNDTSLANQLMGQWCVKVAGLPDVLPEDKVNTALSSIEQLNMAATSYGLVNGVTPEGKRISAGFGGTDDNDHSKHTFVGEDLCAAMTFMYHGRAEVGAEIAKRIYQAVALKSRSPWNQRCLISSETGLPVWGHDYYSDLVIWTVPMALTNQSIAEFVAEGGLVDRMIKAAR